MDRVKTTYLLVAVNVVVVVFVVIFLVMALAKTGDDDGRIDNRGARPVVAGDGSGGATVARGPSPENQPPKDPGPVARIRVAKLPPGETLVPEPGRLPEGTLKKVQETQWLLKRLVLRAELYRTRHGEYPPSTIDDDNKVNTGIEAFFAYLEADNLLDRDESNGWIGNTDDDRFGTDFRLRGAEPIHDERLEILDGWGNPLIYFRHDRYPTIETVKTGGGNAQPQISRLATEYHEKRIIEEHASPRNVPEFHAREFVEIWSAGPNGENENGGGDDVTSWHIRE